MKSRYWLPIVLIGSLLGAAVPVAQSQSIMDRIKAKAKAKLDQKQDDAASSAVNAVDPTTKAGGSPGKSSSSTSSSAKDANATTTEAAPATAAPAGNVPATMTAYQNYDFVPGEQILFADDFTTTQDGEFPTQWEMDHGQAAVNKEGGYEAFVISDGNYGTVNPRMKTKVYLPEQFTVECDYYSVPGAEPFRIFFHQKGEYAQFVISRAELKYYATSVDLTGSIPAAIKGPAFDSKWHHVAVVYHNQQMKLYVDQYRLMTVPDTKLTPEWVQFGGSGSMDKPIVFRNVRIASGGGMNMIGRKLTEAKIVTHGINFEVDKATIRPESMGVLNQIKAVMDQDSIAEV